MNSSYSCGFTESSCKCIYSNVDTLSVSKKTELESIIAVDNPDIVILTEILPKNYHYELAEETYHLEGYNLTLSSLNKRGAAIYIRNTLTTERIILNNFEEYCASSIKLNDS